MIFIDSIFSLSILILNADCKLFLLIFFTTSAGVEIFSLLIEIIRSFTFNPPFSAGPFGIKYLIIAPSSVWERKLLFCLILLESVTPIMGCLALPLVIKSLAIFLALFIGIAKPNPAPGPERTRVLIPITSPTEFNNGPPELPGLIAASV